MGAEAGEGEGLNSRRKNRGYGREKARVRGCKGAGRWRAGEMEERARTVTEDRYKPKDLRREE